MPVTPLAPADLALLRVVHESDRDHGGLASDEMSDDEAETCGRLVERGLVEIVSEFGEAPDGEEDERDAGGHYCVRITGLGVERLREEA
jgi:hypothetical protein